MPRIVLPGPFGSIDVPGDWRKRCLRAQWNEGVRAVAEAPLPAAPSFPAWKFSEVPSAVVADGAGGAFVLATRNEAWPSSQGAFSLRHLQASGVAGALVDLEPPSTYVGVLGIWAEASMVASGRRGVIVASADQSTVLAARAFDEHGHLRSPRSKRGRALCRAAHAATQPRPSAAARSDATRNRRTT